MALTARRADLVFRASRQIKRALADDAKAAARQRMHALVTAFLQSLRPLFDAMPETDGVHRWSLADVRASGMAPHVRLSIAHAQALLDADVRQVIRPLRQRAFLSAVNATAVTLAKRPVVLT